MFLRHIRTLWQDERGVTALEYAVVGVIIVIAIVGWLPQISVSLSSTFSSVASSLN